MFKFFRKKVKKEPIKTKEIKAKDYEIPPYMMLQDNDIIRAKAFNNLNKPGVKGLGAMTPAEAAATLDKVLKEFKNLKAKVALKDKRLKIIESYVRDVSKMITNSELKVYTSLSERFSNDLNRTERSLNDDIKAYNKLICDHINEFKLILDNIDERVKKLETNKKEK